MLRRKGSKRNEKQEVREALVQLLKGSSNCQRIKPGYGEPLSKTGQVQNRNWESTVELRCSLSSQAARQVSPAQSLMNNQIKGC